MKIKKSIICKEVHEFTIDSDKKHTYIPKAGDVAVFKVIELGKHGSIQGPNGNNSYIFPGDYIMMAFGARYATGQFEGYVPDKPLDMYQILGKGGAVGELTSMHAKLVKAGPTNIELIGYAVNDRGEVFNTCYLNREKIKFNGRKKKRPRIILSIGSSMDSGKTTTAGYLARGLSLGEQTVCYIKLTGTVYSKDRSFVRDCGAVLSIDFSTLGFPSTYMCSEEEILDMYEGLLNQVEEHQPDFIIVEVADGLIQRETDFILRSKRFKNTVDGVVFSAGDSMSAMSGLELLEKLEYKIYAIAGLFTASPLLQREVEQLTNYPVLNLKGLADPNVKDHFRKQTTTMHA